MGLKLAGPKVMKDIVAFTFSYLADDFIQNDLQPRTKPSESS